MSEDQKASRSCENQRTERLIKEVSPCLPKMFSDIHGRMVNLTETYLCLPGRFLIIRKNSVCLRKLCFQYESYGN